MTASVSRECLSGCLLDGSGWHLSARLSRFSLLCVPPANKTTTRWHHPNWCPSELSLQLFRGFACPNVSLFSFPSPPLVSLLILCPATEKCEGGDPAEADEFLPAMEEEVLQTQRKDSLLCQRLQGTRICKAIQSCLNPVHKQVLKKKKLKNPHLLSYYRVFLIKIHMCCANKRCDFVCIYFKRLREQVSWCFSFVSFPQSLIFDEVDLSDASVAETSTKNINNSFTVSNNAD